MLTSQVFNQDCLIPDEMLSSASQNSISHVNSAHTQSGSRINTILLLSEHLKVSMEGEKNNYLSLSSS